MKNVLIVNCSPVRDGATAYITHIIANALANTHNIDTVCIDDFNIGYCFGCRSCHESGVCIQEDDALQLINRFEWADIIVLVSPSYWADVPGQFKVFIDRCTPWSNTHEPHASLSKGKKGYAVVLRTGSSMKECDRLIETISHFYGHMQIEYCGGIGLCSVSNIEDAKNKMQEVKAFCKNISQ